MFLNANLFLNISILFLDTVTLFLNIDNLLSSTGALFFDINTLSLNTSPTNISTLFFNTDALFSSINLFLDIDILCLIVFLSICILFSASFFLQLILSNLFHIYNKLLFNIRYFLILVINSFYWLFLLLYCEYKLN